MLKENKKELSSSEDTYSSILQDPKIQNNEKPRFRKHQKRIPKSNRSFQKQVEEVITDVFNDADEDKVEQLSKSLSKFTARMISQKARKLARSYIDDDDDDYDYDDYSNDNRQEQVSFYPQLSPFDQNIMMMQQQQQWFQMIQMNTQRQAQINMQMMYQNQMNHVLKKNTKKRNKK